MSVVIEGSPSRKVIRAAAFRDKEETWIEQNSVRTIYEQECFSERGDTSFQITNNPKSISRFLMQKQLSSETGYLPHK